MIDVTHSDRRYAPDKVRRRYVRWGWKRYFWCEVGDDRRYDLRQGSCDAADLTEDILEAVEARRGHAFAFVEWPL